jgi:hypothetical protein
MASPPIGERRVRVKKQTIMCMSRQDLNAEPTWKLLKEVLDNSCLGFVTQSTTNSRASEEVLKTWGMIRQVDVGFKITPAGREF